MLVDAGDVLSHAGTRPRTAPRPGPTRWADVAASSTSPTTWTPWPNVQSPSTLSDVAFLIDGRALGEPLVELADQLVEVAVQLDVRQALGHLVQHEVLARCRRRPSAAPAGRWWSSPARTGRGRPRSAASPSNTSIAAPMAVSTWITSGVFVSAGSTCFTLRISGSPRMPWRTSRACFIATRSNHRLLVEQNLCRSRSASASRSACQGLRGLAQHEPAVVLAAGEVAALAVGGSTPHRLDRERRTGGGEPAGDPGVGDRAEVVGVGDEDALVAGLDQPVQQAAAAQRRVEVAVPGRTPLEVGVLGPADRREVLREQLGLLVLQELQRQPLDREVRRSGPAPPSCPRRCGSCS